MLAWELKKQNKQNPSSEVAKEWLEKNKIKINWRLYIPLKGSFVQNK